MAAKNFQKKSIAAHKKHKGKLSVEATMPITNTDELSLAYTPGVAGPALAIAADKSRARELTTAKRTVAIVSDGSAVLGLGDIGPEAALPIMEGKAALLKRFAGIDGFPIVLNTQSVEEIVAAVKAISPTFGAINLEDISAPRCFEVEARLIEELDIPVMHDDQHGTAIIILAALINALTVAKKRADTVRVVINGVGAAGVATTKLLLAYGIGDITLVDSTGIIHPKRENLTPLKEELASQTNERGLSGSLADALSGADVFIGLSRGNILTKEMIEAMAPEPAIFALANPTPEIDPALAKRAGARVVATGRSDYPNQINNSLAFPGIYKGLIEGNVPHVTDGIKIAAALALARTVKKPTAEKIVPGAFEEGVAKTVARAVRRAG